MTHWTKDNEQYLIDQLKAGVPVQTIAKALGKTPASVYHKKFNLGLSDGRRPHPVYSDEAMIARVLRLYDEGYTVRGIARETSLTYDLVRRILQRKNARTRPKFSLKGARTYDPTLVERVRRMFLEEKLSQRAIGERLEVRSTLVRDICTSRGFRRSKQWSPEQVRTMERMLEEGKSIEEIAAAIGRPPNGILTKAYQRNLQRRFPQVSGYNRKYVGNMTVDKVLKTRLKTSKRSAEVRGLSFDLDLAFLEDLYREQNGKCFYTGEPMSTVANDETCLSIDRVDSTLGYLKGNVVLTGWNANKMKQDLPLSEFVRLCGVISARFSQAATASHLAA
jgi:hypothetical protein